MSSRTTRTTPRPVRTGGARGRQVQPRRSKLWIWIPIALVSLALVAGGAALLLRQRGGDIEGVVSFSDMPEAAHQQEPVTYAQTPPVGGPHHPDPLRCGIYDQPVPNNNAVHSMEHGAVWITYRPDLPPADVEKLRSLVRDQSHGLLSPFPDLPSPVVASAWGIQLKVDSASDPRLAQFIEKYEEGPQTPEQGVSCRYGVGAPIER